MKLIAYGSLMNQTSLAETLGRQAKLRKIQVMGYQRVFNAPFDDYAFLNLTPARNESIDAAYFYLDRTELPLFAEREAGSSLVEILPGYFAFIWGCPSSTELPVLQSYIEVCVAGANTLGIDFWRGLIPPGQIVNDTRRPLYV